MTITQEDYLRVLALADKWMFRAKVAFQLAEYFNANNDVAGHGWTREQIRHEVDLQTDRLIGMKKKGLMLPSAELNEPV
jgi:hypothetical protein